MPVFKMIKYHKRQYPDFIPLDIQEVAGHFDIAQVRADMPYSLHTEYSYGKRLFTNKFIESNTTLATAHKNGVPQLWKNSDWAEDFASFVISNVVRLREPEVIEIHPPFDDYTDNLHDFIERYKRFEDKVIEKYPNVKIQIENRCGSIYHGGKFSLSTIEQLIDLCEIIEKSKLNLRVALDIPQLYTAHVVSTKTSDKAINLLEKLFEIREYIDGVHLWGKNNINGRRIAHNGDLNTYFMGDQDLKMKFLQSLEVLFSDDKVRHLVLEVNSSDKDITSIVSDLMVSNFIYV